MDESTTGEALRIEPVKDVESVEVLVVADNGGATEKVTPEEPAVDVILGGPSDVLGTPLDGCIGGMTEVTDGADEGAED
jgi:hypothetical protein